MAVDLIQNGNAQGAVATAIMSVSQFQANSMRPYVKDNGKVYINLFKGGDPRKKENWREIEVNRSFLQVNSTLRRDEWKQLDDVVLEASRSRLSGIEDLISNGLTYNLGNAMGTTVLEWHDTDDPGEATISMDGITRGLSDRPNYQYNYLPIPIIHFDYEINARELAASRNMGNPLDTTMAEKAVRRLSEKLESMLFTDVTFGYGEKDQRNRNKIYSYVNHPDRMTYTLGTHWDDLDFDSSTANGGERIVEQVSDMKQQMINAKFYGPYQIYISTNYETVIDKDYNKTTPGTTIRERIMKIANIKGIKVVDTLPADTVLMVNLTKNTVRLIRGMGITNVEWSQEGNMISKYKVMTIQVPQIRSEQNGNCGVLHAS